MKREEIDRKLEEWLDRASAEYGEAGIRPGFENRIAAKLQSRIMKRKWSLRLIQTATAAVAIMFFLLYPFHEQMKIQEKGEITAETELPDVSSPGANNNSGEEDKKIPAEIVLNAPMPKPPKKESAFQKDTVKALEPRRGRFLSSGLGDQERYLMAYVRAKSSDNSADFEEQSAYDPLNIKPLQLEEAQIEEVQIEDFEISTFEIDASPVFPSESEDQL